MDEICGALGEMSCRAAIYLCCFKPSVYNKRVIYAEIF